MNFYSLKDTIEKNAKINPGGKYLRNTHLRKDCHPEYVRGWYSLELGAQAAPFKTGRSFQPTLHQKRRLGVRSSHTGRCPSLVFREMPRAQRASPTRTPGGGTKCCEGAATESACCTVTTKAVREAGGLLCR